MRKTFLHLPHFSLAGNGKKFSLNTSFVSDTTNTDENIFQKSVSFQRIRFWNILSPLFAIRLDLTSFQSSYRNNSMYKVMILRHHRSKVRGQIQVFFFYLFFNEELHPKIYFLKSWVFSAKFLSYWSDILFYRKVSSSSCSGQEFFASWNFLRDGALKSSLLHFSVPW